MPALFLSDAFPSSTLYLPPFILSFLIPLPPITAILRYQHHGGGEEY